MPIILKGQTYYRTKEVYQMVGVSRNTLFRWLKDGGVTDVEYRDHRGWRLFTQAQVDAIKKRMTRISTVQLTGKDARQRREVINRVNER